MYSRQSSGLTHNKYILYYLIYKYTGTYEILMQIVMKNLFWKYIFLCIGLQSGSKKQYNTLFLNNDWTIVNEFIFGVKSPIWLDIYAHRK